MAERKRQYERECPDYYKIDPLYRNFALVSQGKALSKAETWAKLSPALDKAYQEKCAERAGGSISDIAFSVLYRGGPHETADDFISHVLVAYENWRDTDWIDLKDFERCVGFANKRIEPHDPHIEFVERYERARAT